MDYPAVRWIKGQLHLVWRHNHLELGGGCSLYHHVLPQEAFEARTGPKKSVESNAKPVRILPLGDSITRGSYLAKNNGKSTGLPHPDAGGWRKPLQDKLRAAGIAYDFVGELRYAAFGRDNTGPAGSAKIKHGRFDTKRDGEGHMGGPHIIKIIALDGDATEEFSEGVPQFPPFEVSLDLPRENGSRDIEVPADWVPQPQRSRPGGDGP